MTSNRIVVLGTGGTIAGRGAPGADMGYVAGQIGVGELLAGIPELAGVPVATEQVAQIDSKDMAFGVWQALAARCAHWLAQADVAGIVITHGTDTLEETAWFLQRVLAPARPVVITCAMRPATALVPDGPQNLVDAFAVARHPGAQGVTAVCAGVVHGAAEVRKLHPYRLDAFGSGDAGPLAYVEAGRLRRLRAWPQGSAEAALLDRLARTREWPWVEIVTNQAGAGARTVDALVAAGVRGLVAAGTGNGSLNSEMEQALLRAMDRGVRVVRSTRCLDGEVIGQPGDRLPAHPLTPVKARVDLLLELLG
ncbi:asparaginase [Ramlibacter tataouinensis]|uniref:asparaginase n=1 Tax=Ramlibacter tataouinensis TaxID=94132 RepID=UPI003F81A77E